nr:anionic trypsin-like [Onthophagus taurus]
MSLQHFLTSQFSFLFLVLNVPRIFSSTNCTCVPYYQCSEDMEKVLIDGNELLDVRGFKSHCKGYFDVCCVLPKTQNTTIVPNFKKGCGYKKRDDYPWLATLYFQEDIATKPIPRCGVSFIHKQVVLTAAHCFNVNHGLWTIQIDDTTINTKTIKKHPKFNPLTLHNDISVIILEEPFDAITPEQIICIPPPGFVPKPGRCLVGSFDKTNSIEEDIKIVELIDLPIVDNKKCLKSLRQTRLGEFFQLHHSFICAGGEDHKDTCHGDGGSPLVCPISDQPGRYHQIGIVSWGIGCGELNTPGVYVNVAIFREFIDKVMIDNGFDMNSYKY